MPVVGGVVTLAVIPESIYSITTLLGQQRGQVKNAPAPSAPFPATYVV